jgi:serine-type D-Ala-D-Ala carboxypeptidase/endopeptidase (penicillin-binding protein 4)
VPRFSALRSPRRARAAGALGLALVLAFAAAPPPAVSAASARRAHRRHRPSTPTSASPAPPATAPALASAQGAGTALGLALGPQVQAAFGAAGALGVHVVDLASGQTVYGYAPDEPRVIASNTKLLTTAATLHALGPGYFFETRFLARGTVEGGVLSGDLGVVGGGDPNISGRAWEGDSFAVFRGWAQELAARGIRKVTGDLYLDAGLFEPLEIHPDWPRAQLASWYEAPIAALSFSDNCILVRVSPGRPGGPVVVETVPPVAVFRVDNTARTVAARHRGHLAISRLEDLLRVSGTMGTADGPFDTWITVPDPVAYFGLALRAALAQEGIEVAGRLRPVDRLPGPVWERVAVFRSDLLSSVEVCLKHSQNFYAESMVKLLGARRCGRGSWSEGVRAVGEFLAGLGVPRASFRLADGSEMGREDRVAPRALTTLLRAMYLAPEGEAFARALPYGGEEMGGWKRRLAAPPYRGNVWAKTGTLEGVSALSGYARAVSGRLYAFSILLNRVHGDAHHAQDRIVMALVDHG